MEVKNIKNPEFLKKLNESELVALSEDIREFLVDSVSITGGHLSSNLGIVDLTIPLHKVFDISKDKFVFDVSHQCYTHKILTGRAKDFKKLRKQNGLSGFQKMEESKTDSYEAGHSSTSISAALGMAVARDKNHEDFNVVAIIGDGSMGNGLCYEAINHLGEVKSKIIIILNDNEMSISKNVGGLHKHLDKLRSKSCYSNVKNNTKNILNKIPLVGKYISKFLSDSKDILKKLHVKKGFIFEEMGLNYYGPIDGHNYKELIKYLEIAKNDPSPVLLHVVTKKGKGYEPCENDTLGIWHGVGPFNKETGEIIKKNDGLITWSEVISNNLIKLTKDNKKINVITPAMASGSKLLKYKELYPDNFIDVGIAEEHALLFANGMALNNIVPFVSIYSTFLQRGYDEIIHDIARMDTHVILGIDRAGIVGEDGETHQGIYDLTFLLPIPNMIVCTPYDAIEAGNLLYTATITNHPFAIRYSRDRLEYNEVESYKKIKIGSWTTLEDGKDACIISYGYMLNKALEVRDLVKDKKDLAVINARFQKPIDEKLFKSLLNKYKKIYIYEEQTVINSLGSYLLQYASNLGYKGDIKIFAIEDKFVRQGSKEQCLASLGLDSKSIANYILKDK